MFLLEPSELLGVGILVKNSLEYKVAEGSQLLYSDYGDVLNIISIKYLSFELISLFKDGEVGLAEGDDYLSDVFGFDGLVLLANDGGELIIIQEIEVSG